MKTKLTLLLTSFAASAIFLLSCDSKIKTEDPTILLNPPSITFGYLGGIETVTLSSSSSDLKWSYWQISSDTWFTIVESDDKLYFRAEEWDGEQSRSSTVTFSAPGAGDTFFIVTQLSRKETPVSLNIKPESLFFTARGVCENNEITVETNAEEWSAVLADEKDRSWITIEEDKVQGKFSVNVREYHDTDKDRSAKIIVSVATEGVSDKIVELTQTKYSYMEDLAGVWLAFDLIRDNQGFREYEHEIVFSIIDETTIAIDDTIYASVQYGNRVSGYVDIDKKTISIPLQELTPTWNSSYATFFGHYSSRNPWDEMKGFENIEIEEKEGIFEIFLGGFKPSSPTLEFSWVVWGKKADGNYDLFAFSEHTVWTKPIPGK